MATNADHVTTKPGRSNVLLCGHCGDEYFLRMPKELGAYGAALKAFSKLHARCRPDPVVVAEVAEGERRRLDTSPCTPAEWRDGPNVGLSALTIWHVLHRQERSPGGDIPLDPADFGRCHRLLERIPGWRDRLAEVGWAHPRWVSHVAAWPELTALYLEEMASGSCPRLYARMNDLRAASRKAVP